MSRENIEKLLSDVDIIDVMNRYISLQKKGNTYWACCPFHSEKTPSFSVSSDKQLYYCFGCKASGNVLTFLQQIENIDFLDAVKLLCSLENLNEENYLNFKKSNFLDKEKKQRGYALLKETAKYYHNELMNESSLQSKKAMEYLRKRCISDKAIKKFGLGVSPSFDGVINYLEKQGYSKNEMYEFGVADLKNNKFFDAMSLRLVIPIINSFSEVIAFGGRIFSGDESFAKYKNTKQTMLFDKGETIFAMNLLKQKKNKHEIINNIIITEGYMDVIALHTQGFDTAVASMGTAFSLKQARILKFYSKNIVLLFDGDVAGQKATERTVDILQPFLYNIKVVSLENGVDPDEFLKKFGKEELCKLIQNASPFVKYKIDKIFGKYDITKMEEKIAFAKDASEVIAKLDYIEKAEYAKYISNLSKVAKESIVAQASDYLERQEVDTEPNKEKNSTEYNYDSDDIYLLAYMMHYFEKINLKDYDNLFLNENSNKIFDFVYKKVEENKDPIDKNIYSYFEDNLNELVSRLVNFDFSNEEKEFNFFYRAVTRKKIKNLKIKKATLDDEIVVDFNEEKLRQREKIIQEIVLLNNNLKG